ncbi:MAG: hypothetical protein FJ271_22830 [Planctomycetes bacterium]|nr:hypothetical protein [Planctomycetota bacterium]
MRGPLAALLLLAPISALAHGDAAWIRDNPKTAWCCNEKDCGIAPADAITRVDGGWQVIRTGQVIRDGDPSIYPSPDLHIWWCRWPDPNNVRCLFIPPAGS